MISFSSVPPLKQSGILLTFGLLIFGFADNLTLLVSDQVSVGQFHFSRSLCAIFVVLIFSRLSSAKIFPKNWKAVFVRAFFNVVAMLLYFGVIPMMPIAEAGAGLFTSPIFILVFSYIFFKENITKRQIFSFLLGLLGVALILGNDYSNITLYHIFPVLAGASYAMGTIVTNRYLKEEDPVAILLCFLFSIGLVGLLLTVFFTVNPVKETYLIEAPFIFKPWSNQGIFFWAVMIFLGFTSSSAIYLMIKAYQISRPSYAAIYEYTYLISAGFFSWLFWGSVPTFASLCGIIAIVIAGINIIMAKGSTS
tara:strand:- start:1114 stop:2037 length:924 start_codon:yes stop_codon:yes gene_type:complete